MKAKDYVHAGIIHKDIMEHLPLYLNKHPGKSMIFYFILFYLAIGQFLQNLRVAGKKVFLNILRRIL